MTIKTGLYHGFPIILKNNNWVLISPYFDEIIHIPSDKINEQSVFDELEQKGFFEKDKIKQRSSDFFHVDLITTSDCNLHCKYCFTNSGESKKIMNLRMATTAIKYGMKMAKGKNLSISFFGGEPSLTSSLIIEAVEYAKKNSSKAGVKKVQFGVTTNGTMPKKFLNFLLENDFSIAISSDGPPIVQDYHRPFKNGGKSSEIVEENIKYLVSSNKEFKLRSTVTNYSVKYLVDTVEWLHSLGGSQIHFEPVSMLGRANASLHMKGESIEKPPVNIFASNLKLAIKKGSELGVQILNSSYINFFNPPSEFCHGSVNNKISLSYTGDITTCVEVQDKNHPVFDQFAVGKFDDSVNQIVINRKTRKRAVFNSQKDYHNFSNCIECFAKKICAGGCAVRNYHTTGDSTLVDPYWCQLAKETIPFVINLFDEVSFENGV